MLIFPNWLDEIKCFTVLQHLVNTKNKSDSLNMVLTNNLTRSLSREEMKDVDVQVLKGVVYISLSDNMLYKSGSYEISDKAGETLSKIAKIIQDYKDYEVLIEGNTDTDPISKTNIRNNWDLSTLRASSVVQALQNTYGVDPKRLTAGGRGQYNPIADNSTAAGKMKNRRTQIIITPKLDQFMDLIDKAPEKENSSVTEGLIQIFNKHEIFGLRYPVSCYGIPDDILNAKKLWKNDEAYDLQAAKLAALFISNMNKYGVSEDILKGGPQVAVQKTEV
ncbi:hypothetical protein FQR65_LT15607 [Abscondita terminalis]|nr:hypothetical protein FQR65_LT15607 [Abscondita terminalis]